jgi:UDP-N-acetylmuramate: L-alanyl-gamma-D-glutamyl-meso-diaminopimelate ligase
MKVHFIAIGGSVMHNLAIALKKKGYEVSGSDDQIFDPARSNLQKHQLLPQATGWHPEKIHKGLDAVILGMHAHSDNPELEKARQLNLKIWSFPEYIYEQTKNKKRVVIGGSHGKTTITSMVMHVLRHAGIRFDYMVGARIEGFDTMVGLSRDAKIAVFEGDEYLSSPIDPRPKFHLYQPHIAVISGISWDHINVFPTFEDYLEQFHVFTRKIRPKGTLIYFNGDSQTVDVARHARKDIRKVAYGEHPRNPDGTKLLTGEGREIPFHLIGAHNAANAMAAMQVVRALGLDNDVFYQAIPSFKGASRRLQVLAENDQSTIFLDFAHAPSKLKATISAVKKRFPNRKLVACMELHTFSSLNKDFIGQYAHTMDQADLPVVYYNPETIRHKDLEMIEPAEVREAFALERLRVYTDVGQLKGDLLHLGMKNTNLLLMTSGNFNGINLYELSSQMLPEASS